MFFTLHPVGTLQEYNSSWNLDSWERERSSGFPKTNHGLTSQVGAALGPFALHPDGFATQLSDCSILSKSWKLRSANFPEIQIAILIFYQCFIRLLSLTWWSICFWVFFNGYLIWREQNCDVKLHCSTVCGICTWKHWSNFSWMHGGALCALAAEEGGSDCFNFPDGCNESIQRLGYLNLCTYATNTLGCFDFQTPHVKQWKKFLTYQILRKQSPSALCAIAGWLHSCDDVMGLAEWQVLLFIPRRGDRLEVLLEDSQVFVSAAAETIPALILGKDLQLPLLLCQGSCSSLGIPAFLFYISPFPISGSISGLLWLLKWLDLLKFIFSSCDLCNSLFHPICIHQSSLVQVKSGSCSTNQKWSDKMDEYEMSKWEELSILLWVPELCTLSALPPSAVSPRCAHSSRSPTNDQLQTHPSKNTLDFFSSCSWLLFLRILILPEELYLPCITKFHQKSCING